MALCSFKQPSPTRTPRRMMRVAVHAGKPFDGANAATLDQGGDDLDCLSWGRTFMGPNP